MPSSTMTEASATSSLWREYLVLSKPRISVMVLFTVAVAALVSLPAAVDADVWNVVHAMIGLLLVSASGCALNQYLERYVDWMMPRTAKRPLPDERLSSLQVSVFGAVTFGAGIAWLLALVNWQTAVVAGVSWVLYVWIYTPLKRLTWLNTYVGAVAGALPVLVGSTAAASGQITWPAFWLFAVLYVWQFPHFMAIAWLYREDYVQGGVKMASTVDKSGRLVGWHAVLFAVLLIPVSVIGMWPDQLAGWLMLAAVIALGTWYLWASVRFAQQVDETRARSLFRVSLLYLPVYLVALSIASLIQQ
ncbi:MAG: heme o synthase [Pirellulaceae bacterium]